ncbi:activating signal cointegrator 1 complex subunit 3 [Ceratobasidium sp. AG-Ba]|nr:activating signal cointegrator 1 complex subunit 3 [Ceratobasidium sp. AG-Ba]
MSFLLPGARTENLRHRTAVDIRRRHTWDPSVQRVKESAVENHVKDLKSIQEEPKLKPSPQSTYRNPGSKTGNHKTGYVQGPRPGYDDYGQELGKTARVWKTYMQEASRYDADMANGWNNSLDLILKTNTTLVFAALFSAVATAFVIESLKALQPDPAETSVQMLSAISQTLVFIANAQAGSTLSLTVPESASFVAPKSAIWVNALWFLSLSLSIAVSLIAMLGKGWAREYMADLTGQPYEQARKRQQRWDSLEEWKMPQIIMLLPTFLHLALLLFGVGLTIYLWDIHPAPAIPVLVVVLIATFAYATSTILPIAFKHCPFGTPLSKLLLIALPFIPLKNLWLMLASRMFRAATFSFRWVLHKFQLGFRSGQRVLEPIYYRYMDAQTFLLTALWLFA